MKGPEFEILPFGYLLALDCGHNGMISKSQFSRMVDLINNSGFYTGSNAIAPEVAPFSQRVDEEVLEGEIN